MAIFDVFLSRIYRVEIDAEDEVAAARLSEFLIDGDNNVPKEYEIFGHKCKIIETELIENNAFESHHLSSEY